MASGCCARWADTVYVQRLESIGVHRPARPKASAPPPAHWPDASPAANLPAVSDCMRTGVRRVRICDTDHGERAHQDRMSAAAMTAVRAWESAERPSLAVALLGSAR